MAATKEGTLLDSVDSKEPSLVPAVRTPEVDGVLGVIERLSAAGLSTENLRELVALQERILDRNAKAAFEAAFAKMQPDLPEIDEKGKIVVKGVQRSTYAKLEDIQKAIKPILKQHGFAIRHRTEWPADKPNIIRVVGILSHEQGHREESCFEAPADPSDYRSDIQSQGSTVSYGRRYTTLDLLNITTRGMDNDGQQRVVVPEGFDAWFAALEGVVAEGINALTERFATSRMEFKNHAVEHKRDEWAAMRQRAQKVRVSR